MIDNMTLREKVGQLFWIRPDVLTPARYAATAADPTAPALLAADGETDAVLRQYPVGGFVLFAKNLSDPAQLAALQKGLAAPLPTPPIFAVDEEGGRVARLANCEEFALPRYPAMGLLAAEKGADGVRCAAAAIGGYLKQHGFGIDFAPVADVNTNPANPVIGTRAFADDPSQAAAFVTAAVEGFAAAGMGCTLKHFPGHGDTAQDSHVGCATSAKTWQEMCGCELLPFAAGIAAGAEAVMAAHITTPNASSDGLPASLSYTMLTERLRGQLGFDGLIITDSLGMGAIRNNYPDGEAAVLAFLAGADVLLMPADLPAAFDGVLAAAESGRISPARLDESVERILNYKKKHRILD